MINYILRLCISRVITTSVLTPMMTFERHRLSNTSRIDYRFTGVQLSVRRTNSDALVNYEWFIVSNLVWYDRGRTCSQVVDRLFTTGDRIRMNCKRLVQDVSAQRPSVCNSGHEV